MDLPLTGQEPPLVQTRPPGPQTRTWATRFAHHAAPMGVKANAGGRGAVPDLVLATGQGSNLVDVDGNRFVDLAAGFGSVLLGHSHPRLRTVLTLQSERLSQGLGDVYPSQPKVALLERLAELHWETGAQVLLAQSGADAVSAALKTAVLFTGRAGVLAFRGAYHGLGYAPLAASDLRAGYREPFAAQLNPHVTFIDYPADAAQAGAVLSQVRQALAQDEIGALLIEPILGRAGVIVPPANFLSELTQLVRASNALLIADEIWTGLGRSGSWLYAVAQGAQPDLICLGKGLGGMLPLSACIGRRSVMAAWQAPEEVVHTSTFAGAPLACAGAISLLDVIQRDGLVTRAAQLGSAWLSEMRGALGALERVRALRGAGLMLGVELDQPGAAAKLQRALLADGYIVTTGGGKREVLVLTPALTISEKLLSAFVPVLQRRIRALA